MKRCNLYFSCKQAGLIIFCGVFLFIAATPAAEQPTFSASPYTCVFDTTSKFAGPIVTACVNGTEEKRLAIVKNMLDSLGFFNPAFDTTLHVIHIRPGFRSRIDSLVIKSSIPCAIDSVAVNSFPRFYDAGEIQTLAKKVLYFFSCRGSPFATLTIAIIDTAFVDDKNSGRMRYSLVVVFNVRENGCYAFAVPRLLGNFKTNTRLIGRDVVIGDGAKFDVRKVEETQKRLLTRSYIAAVETKPPKILNDTAFSTGTAERLKSYAGSVVAPFLITDNSGLGLDGAIAFQAGASAKNSLSGIFNISLNNIFHHGEVGLFSYKGETDYQRMEVSLSGPYLLGLPLFGFTGFGLEVQQNQYGYLHGELKLLTEWWPYWQWGALVNAHEITRYVDSADFASNFEGVDFVVSRQGKQLCAGEFSSDLDFKIGSGIKQSMGQQLNRWHIDLNTGVQVPFGPRHALALRAVGATIIANRLDTLQTVELYRTGGYKSLRGYADNEFAFKSVLYEQLEYRYYFNARGSVYIFMDAGMGFNENNSLKIPSATKMLGYGLGIRIPVKIGNADIAWARNFTDAQNWGRIHIGISNSISLGLAK